MKTIMKTVMGRIESLLMTYVQFSVLWNLMTIYPMLGCHLQ